MVNFCPATIELWMREDGIYLVPLKYTLVCRTPTPSLLGHTQHIITCLDYDYSKSRHTVVCRAAQEAGVPHREYIYRKKENVIFPPLYLGDSLSD